MDTAFLKEHLGDCLTTCLAEVAEKRPRDPVEYVAQWLYKYMENKNFASEKVKELKRLEEEKINFEKEQDLKAKRKVEAEQIAKEDAERKKAEAERALKESSSSKLPPVVEAPEPSEDAQKNAEASGEKTEEKKEEQEEEKKEETEEIKEEESKEESKEEEKEEAPTED